jgi:hypothetical protein
MGNEKFIKLLTIHLLGDVLFCMYVCMFVPMMFAGSFVVSVCIYI